MYCGNNATELVGRRLGTPYECLKKGIGAGMRAPGPSGPSYVAIFRNDKFCGNGNLPRGMIYGTPSECLSKGFGIGKSLQRRDDGRGDDWGDDGGGAPFPPRYRLADGSDGDDGSFRDASVGPSTTIGGDVDDAVKSLRIENLLKWILTLAVGFIVFVIIDAFTDWPIPSAIVGIVVSIMVRIYLSN